MRLSTREDDPGYVRGLAGVKVFFNGYERKHVFTADEEKGMIVAAALDAQGRVQLNADRSDVLTETLYGVVRMELPPELLARILEKRERNATLTTELSGLAAYAEHRGRACGA